MELIQNIIQMVSPFLAGAFWVLAALVFVAAFVRNAAAKTFLELVTNTARKPDDVKPFSTSISTETQVRHDASGRAS
jgi:C4-dicarboxylate transporter